MSRIRPIFIASVAVSTAAAAAWALFGYLAVTHRAPTVLAIDRAAAVLLGTVTAMCWMDWRRAVRDRRREQRDKDRTILIRTLSRTVPMPPVR